MPYRTLDPDKTIKTIARLYDRIVDRFPDSSLSKLCGELLLISTDTEAKVRRIAKPNIFLRITVVAFLILVFAGMIYSASLLNFEYHSNDLADLITLFEASINDILLMGAAIYFLFTIEGRVKRNRALKGLHELRAICHVIDMHQLTKDPSALPLQNTLHSPKHGLSPYELGRYLDYCSEMLALAGKVATLYANGSGDAVVLNAINEVENLSMGLSNKIWQKIIILDQTGTSLEED